MLICVRDKKSSSSKNWQNTRQHETGKPESKGSLAKFAEARRIDTRHRGTLPRLPRWLPGNLGPDPPLILPTFCTIDTGEGDVKGKVILLGVFATASSPEEVEDQDPGLSR